MSSRHVFKTCLQDVFKTNKCLLGQVFNFHCLDHKTTKTKHIEEDISQNNVVNKKKFLENGKTSWVNSNNVGLCFEQFITMM